MRAAWILWFVVLTSTPYHLAEPYDGPVLTGFYAWVATGLFVVGAALALRGAAGLQGSLDRCRASRRGQAALTALLVLGFLAGVALCLFELSCLPVAFLKGPEAVYGIMIPPEESSLANAFGSFHIRKWVERVGFLLLAFSALMWALAPLLVPSAFEGRAKRASAEEKPGELKGTHVGFMLLVFAGSVASVTAQYAVFHSAGSVPLYSLEARWGIGERCWALTILPWLLNGVMVAALVAFTREYGACDGRWYTSFLLSYALGALTWNFASRSAFTYEAVPPVVWAALTALGVLVTIALAALIYVVMRVRRCPPAGEEARANQEVIHPLDAMELEALVSQAEAELAGRTCEGALEALTTRELQCVGCLLRGLSSSQTATALNLKSSTVRAYLQRAYKKLGVACGEALLRAADMGEGLTAEEEQREHRNTPACPKAVAGHALRPMPWLRVAVVLAAFFVFGALVGSDGAPTSGRALVFGLASGFLLVGFFGALRSGCQGNEGPVRGARQGWCVALGLVLLAILVCGWAYGGWSEWVVFLTALVAAAVLAWLALASSVEVPGGEHMRAACSVTGAQVLVCVCAGLIVQLSLMEDNTPLTACLEVSAITALGFAAATALLAQGRTVGLRLAVVALLVVVLACIGDVRLTAPLAGAVTLGLLLCMRLSVGAQCVSLACVGVGLGFGRIASNVVADTITCYSWLFGLQDPATPRFLMYAFATAVVLAIVIAFAYGQLYREVKGRCLLAQSMLSNPSPYRRRVEGYLQSRGLTETQAQVGWCLLERKTTHEICDGLYLSQGTVNNSRHVLYRTLDVNTLEGFAKALEDALRELEEPVKPL